ncbi:MAG: heparan-alpha-glucosaminide N-acetyltransferase domain-containing protein [Candidatus Kapaibacteriales bacterium]
MLKEKSERLFTFDFLRVIAMMMMVIGHSFFDLVNPDFYNISKFPWNFWNFLRGLTAPIFLFVSGFVQIYANKRDESGKLPHSILHRRIRTAILLLFIGYALNFPVRKMFEIFFVDRSFLHNFYQVNILQLFGVILLLTILFYHLTRNNIVLGIISGAFGFLVLALNTWVHLVDWDNILPSFLASYLSLKSGSYFTFFPFASFFFFGVAFGAYIQRFPFENRYLMIQHKAFNLGLILLPIGLLLFMGINTLNLPFYDVEKGNVGMSIIRLSKVLLLLSFITFLYQKYSLMQNLNRYTTILGRNALFVYVFHLLILYGLPWYGGLVSLINRKIGIAESFVISFLIMLSSFAFVFLFEEFSRKERFFRPIFKFGSISLAILLLLI